MTIAFDDPVFTSLQLHERDILLHAGMGCNRRQTATALNYKPRYVKSALAVVRNKLQAVNTRQALVHAYALGELILPTREEIEEIIYGQKAVVATTRACENGRIV